MIIPQEDGISHINIYSKGKTKLGRDLSNFASIGFIHPEYGSFESVEGFWYWLSTGKKHDELKNLFGYKAKQFGKNLVKEHIEGFNEEILEAIRCKLRQNKKLLSELMKSSLPFEHYYWYGTEENPKVYELPQYRWMIDEIERIRKLMKEKYE